MRAVIQRTKNASVSVNNKIVASIENGLLILLGIEDLDNKDDIEWLSKKIVNLRIFSDEGGQMNNCVKQIDGDIIVVSQFTLFAAVKKGNRPNYMKASKPEIAIPLYEEFVKQISLDLGKKVQTGIFGAHMEITINNSGPVTIVIDTKNKQ